MQRGRRAQKHAIEVDGVRLTGLTNIAGLNSEKKSTEVSDGDLTTTITNGDKSVPPLEMTFMNQQGSQNKALFDSWYNNNEIHSLTVIYLDGNNFEFERKIYAECECSKFADPDNDQTAATQATFDVTILSQTKPETIRV